MVVTTGIILRPRVALAAGRELCSGLSRYCVYIYIYIYIYIGVLPNERVVGLKENPCGIAAWSAVVVANYIFYVCATRAMTNCPPLSVLVGDIVDGPVSALVLPSTSAPVGWDLHSKQIDALVSG